MLHIEVEGRRFCAYVYVCAFCATFRVINEIYS
jgi:hypothetical protein